jgi:hypothetical protein
MGFVNTVDVLGDDVVVDSIIEGTITEFRDDTITKIGAGKFYACKNLKLVDLPNVTDIGSVAFFGSTALETLILRKNAVCTLGANALFNTGFWNGRGHIYVPDNLVATYKLATNWSEFAAKIKPLSELEE